MKTFVPKETEIERKWLLVDANDLILGRLASEVAMLLMGKRKPSYTPFMDTGDFVVVVNADKIAWTGRKSLQKIYYHHTGHFGGIKQATLSEMMNRKPEQVIRLAIQRMLPKGRLGRAMYKKLKVYAGNEHPHQAQQPQLVTLDNIK